ncbi:MAG: HAD hydrolase family protein [Clostridia bacterium]|nr:HAD hydrolase family protein [Clostridia bacterium]
MPQAVKTIAKEIGADQYTICGNGTLIYDLQKEEIIYNAFMEKEKVLKIIKICEENSIYYNVYTENEVITKSLNYNTLFYDKENSKKPMEKRTNINIVENVYKYIENKQDIQILKMTICDNDKIIFGSIIKKLKLIPKIDILEIEHMSKKVIKDGTLEVPIEYYYTEIAKKNTNKWTAIEYLIKKLNIKPDEVMTIGDNANDKEMVEKAGLGVSMGNSMLSANNIGDVFVSDNNQNGVAEAINQYINNRKEM